mgnify:CR=1 FL=1
MIINKDKFFYLGIFFLIVQTLVFIRNEILNDHILFFYYCDHIALFLSIAFFIRNIPLIKALISTGLILQLIYLIDLISYYIFGVEITGTTKYLISYDIFSMIVTLLMHLGTVFVALFYVYKEENKRISLFYALLYLIFLYTTTIIFTHPSYDMNCIFNACGLSISNINFYTKYWIGIAFLLLIIPTHLFQELIYKIKSEK